MTVKLIQIHEFESGNTTAVARLFITNCKQGKMHVDCGLLRNSSLPFMDLYVNNYADAHESIVGWLNELHAMQCEVTLAILSDCDAISAMDAAFIASMALPNVRIEAVNGGQIPRFWVHCATANVPKHVHSSPTNSKVAEVCHG